MSTSSKINVLGTEITILKNGKEDDLVSLTDILKAKEGDFFISDWLRNRNTVAFLSIWETKNNPSFNYSEFAIIKSQAGLNSYRISTKEWILKTNAIGIKAIAGRYGGTYAPIDIAFEFGMWLSPEFQIDLINEFQRLKDNENSRHKLEWNLKRILAKVNYKIPADAIKENLIPAALHKNQTAIIYGSAADVLNRALFGKTAQQWRDENPTKRKKERHGKHSTVGGFI